MADVLRLFRSPRGHAWYVASFVPVRDCHFRFLAETWGVAGGHLLHVPARNPM
jgi:hypothetical protein